MEKIEYFCGVIFLFIFLYIVLTIHSLLKNYLLLINKNIINKNIINYFTPKNIKPTPTQEIIPRKIFQSWHTKYLPPKMKECVESIKEANPNFKHYLYDDKKCRNFIKRNFDKDVLYAYDKLKPISYKIDLWRCCILYKKGGIYLDIKYKPVNDFSFESLLDKEYFCLDRPCVIPNTSIYDELNIINNPNYYNSVYNIINPTLWKNKKIGLQCAVLVTLPNNKILYECIQQIVNNCKSNYYGHNPLYVTGPGLFGEVMFKIKDDYYKYNHFDLFFSCSGLVLHKKNGPILKEYKEYRKEQSENSDIPHYGILWNNRDIYNDI
jgi:hypothetical protein